MVTAFHKAKQVSGLNGQVGSREGSGLSAIGAFKVEVLQNLAPVSLPILVVQSTSLLPLVVKHRILCVYLHDPYTTP